MLRANIVPSEILEERKRRAAYMKKCRLTYLITGDELSAQTKISTQIIYRMENGRRPWMIDSEIRYIMGIIALAKQKRYYDIHARKTPECSVEEMRRFLNLHK